MTCVCGHEKHAFSEPTVCTVISCYCEKYREATPENPVIHKWTKYVEDFNTVKEKVSWLLENIKFLRNYPNKKFVDWFYSKVDNSKDPETIRRTKQKLVQTDPEAYGPFNPELLTEKAYKQLAIEEAVIMN